MASIMKHTIDQRPHVQANTQTENWCGVLQEVVLPGLGSDPAAFLDAAVSFCNEKYVFDKHVCAKERSCGCIWLSITTLVSSLFL